MVLLDDGNFEGKAVVPSGWVERMRRPTSADGSAGFGVELAAAAHGAEPFAAEDLLFLRGPGRWRLRGADFRHHQQRRNRLHCGYPNL